MSINIPTIIQTSRRRRNKLSVHTGGIRIERTTFFVCGLTGRHIIWNIMWGTVSCNIYITIILCRKYCIIGERLSDAEKLPTVLYRRRIIDVFLSNLSYNIQLPSILITFPHEYNTWVPITLFHGALFCVMREPSI